MIEVNEQATRRPDSEYRKNYNRVHAWLIKTYGKADHCEHPHCLGRSQNFEWSKLINKIYAKDRDHFWQLCKQCHLLYDRRPGWTSPNTYVGRRTRNCEWCKKPFHYLKWAARFCSNSCSASFKGANGVVYKAWSTRLKATSSRPPRTECRHGHTYAISGFYYSGRSKRCNACHALEQARYIERRRQAKMMAEVKI